jgi:nitrous oxide reductase accessory protein NosL
MRPERAFALLLAAALAMSAAGPVGAAEPAPTPAPKDRCGVCGMYVAKYPQWIASVRFDDGAVVFFDGPKDLFRFLLDLDTFRPGATRDEVADVFVTDYYSTRPIDGRAAFYVIGSDVMGPMGSELVPTADRDQAEALAKDHGGERVVVFDEVTVELLQP